MMGPPLFTLLLSLTSNPWTPTLFYSSHVLVFPRDSSVPPALTPGRIRFVSYRLIHPLSSLSLPLPVHLYSSLSLSLLFLLLKFPLRSLVSVVSSLARLSTLESSIRAYCLFLLSPHSPFSRIPRVNLFSLCSPREPWDSDFQNSFSTLVFHIFFCLNDPLVLLFLIFDLY
ncbi:hypothetical protein SODALDRAFT_44800 [Sodiomyces alkalinus F11]|uniref:Uncharacterized protein n=1 Tax=Sodiomyces alkalinus (strain CBS 110278 / VKM F-3762 / F11) TaxID=1314773 RepID=A0A3N2QAA3_SODAK|nr:hypothetical protein SODALDRAFT_44800 [Sodiomyces alkalinus F11]ROT43693.1 hypothetical protein SODALDRAFT_44800 [Sodiomyces alkalinus F11]